MSRASAGCRWYLCLFGDPDGLAALEADSPPIGGRFTEDAATLAHGFDGRHQRLTLGFLFVLPNLVTRLSLRLRQRSLGPPLCFSYSFALIHTQKILLTAIHRRSIARQPDCIHLVTSSGLPFRLSRPVSASAAYCAGWARARARAISNFLALPLPVANTLSVATGTQKTSRFERRAATQITARRL